MESRSALKRLTAPTATVIVGAAELEVADDVEAVRPVELCANPTGIKAAARTKESKRNIMTLRLIF